MWTCRNCGNVIQVMCQQGTGFCSQNCESNYAAHLETVRIASQNLEDEFRKGMTVAHAS